MSARFPTSLSLGMLALMLSACGPAAPDEDAAEQEQAIAAQRAAERAAAAAPAGETPPAPACDASQAEGLAGQVYDEALAEQARADAGARRVRALRPGQAVTLEFDGERLNIELGDDGRIVALRCG